MMPTRDKKQDSNRDDRKEQIKQAALRVFARRGLDGTKMSMIAAEAGISDGLSYRYFKSKDEILALLIREAVDGANEAFEQMATLPGSPLDKVRALTSEMIDENNHYFLLMQQVLRAENLPEEVKHSLDSYSTDRFIQEFAIILSAGQQAGMFIMEDSLDQAKWYLNTVTGMMQTDTSTVTDYNPPGADFFLRLIVKP